MLHFSTRLTLALILLLTLLPDSLKAQSVPRAEADSLLQVLAVSKADTNRVKVLLRLGEYQVYKPGEFKVDMDSAQAYALQAKELSIKLNYYRGEAKSLNLLGTISRESKDFPQSITYHKQAINLYRRNKNLQAEAGSYLLLAHALRDSGDGEQARKEVQKAIDVYSKNGYSQQAAEAYLEMGNTFSNWSEEVKKKIFYYQQALEVFSQAGNKRRQADIHKDLGDLYQLQGNYAHSLIELRKALALYQSINYPQLQGVYDLLGYSASAIGDYQEGIKYGLKAVETAESLNDTTMQMCTIYNRVGITYYHLQEYQKAFFYYKKSLHIAQKYDHLPSILLLTGNIVNLLMHTSQPEEALDLLLLTARKYPPQDIKDSIYVTSRLLETYTKLKKYAIAQLYCDQLLILSDKVGKRNSLQSLVYWHVIIYFLASKQHEQARRYLSKYEELCKETHNLRETSMAKLYWFKLDSIQGNYTSAIKHYQKYKLLQDSLFNESKSRQIASLDVLHETERKEKDIQLKEQSIKALTKERLLQEEQIKKDELIRNVIIGGAVLLLLLLGVIYNRYRLKQRSNQLLEAQQQVLQAQQKEINEKNEHLSQLLEEKDTLLVQKDNLIEEKDGLLTEKEWLLKEIHHRVKNNLQVVMSLLDSQADSLQDKAALSAIQESQHRVQAMALIHQKLYQSESLARIPMTEYIEEVVAYLNDSYSLYQPIRFDVEVEDIELDVTLAVPLGLIINEAITNAFKYAFPDERSGTITVRLQRLEQASYELVIADDGVGLPASYDPSRSRSLGMTLIHGFSRQLGGKLIITSPPGMCISLKFQEDQLIPVKHSAQYA
jgi:two-component sensor histidine kinase/tetratricopeptide (TPR) repeat protein